MSTRIVLSKELAHVAYHLANAAGDPMRLPSILGDLVSLSGVNYRTYHAAYPEVPPTTPPTVHDLLNEMCGLRGLESPMGAIKALEALSYNFDGTPDERGLLAKIEDAFYTTVWKPWFAEWAKTHLPGYSLSTPKPDSEPEEEPGPSSAQIPLFQDT